MSSNSSSAAGGGGSSNNISQINYKEAYELLENLEKVINKSETIQADDLADDLLNKNFEKISEEDGKTLLAKINKIGAILGKKNFLIDNPLLNKVDKILANIKNQTQSFVNRGADMAKRLPKWIATAAQQNVEAEYGLKDLEETNQYLQQFSKEIAEYATLHAAILDAKKENKKKLQEQLEAEAKIREAAIDAAITAQQAIRLNSVRAKLLSGKLRPDEYFALEKKTDEKITDLGRKEQTLAVQAETAYVKKIKNYLDAWKDIIPSWQGAARTAAGAALMPSAVSALGLRDAVQSILNAGPSPIPTGLVTSFVSNAVSKSAVQVGGLIGLTYLIAVYGPSFVDTMKDAIDLADQQLGDLVNYFLRIVTPASENLGLLAGISNHGPSEYEAGDYSRMDHVAQEIIPVAIQNDLARLAATPIPGSGGDGSPISTGAEILQAAASGDQPAQQKVAAALDQVASRAPSRAGTAAASAVPSTSNTQEDDFYSFGGRRRRQRRSTKRTRSTKRRRSTKRIRYTKKRRSTKRRQTKRR